MAARILVADDSVTIQKVVELTFSKEEFVLVQARNGEEAIRKAKAERPDLVLLDLVMPDKSGYEVCAAMRADPAMRGVPIIFLTGTFEAFDKEKGSQVGGNDFVTKPFESQVLITKVKKLLASMPVQRAAPAPPAAPTPPAPPREVSRPAPVAAPPPPPAAPPRPTPGTAAAPAPTPAPARGVAPGVARGGVTPTPTPPAAPPRTVAPPQPRPVSPPPGPARPPAAVPPVRPAAPAAATPRAARMPDVPPPAAMPQDRTRRVVEPAPSAPPPPSGFGELSLEDLTTLPLPESPGGSGDLHAELAKAAPEPATTLGDLSLEMPPLMSEPVREAGEPEVPGGLTLEGLLSAELTAATLTPEPEPAAGEESTGGPVFDLTSEMGGPSLPLVEVGTGEPPALSIEDLLVPKETAQPDAEATGVQELELELTPDSSLEETTVAAPPLELEGLTPFSAEPPPAAPPPEAATPSPGEPAVSLPDTAAMRQAVTERVARELAVDLSDKLLERIERIVWDVVPDLAEILIAKEIEKIRAVAEGKQPS